MTYTHEKRHLWRLKTSEEFEKELGPDWAKKLKYGWNENGQMDWLLGRNLSDVTTSVRLVVNDSRNKYGWLIDHSMLTPIDPPKAAMFDPATQFESHMESRLEDLKAEMAKGINELKRQINQQKKVPLTKKELQSCLNELARYKEGGRYNWDNVDNLDTLLNWALALKDKE